MVMKGTILVTGGMGFIGSNFIRHILNTHPEARIVNFDKLTYSGNLDTLRDVEKHPRYRFIQGDICNQQAVHQAMNGVNIVAHFAAETHVDISIKDPLSFTNTNVLGTHVLLEEARQAGVSRFLHISTDEVYGHRLSGSFGETDMLCPRNPYAASKAAAEKIVQAYFTTFNLPVIITRTSNNYGPYQYPEKLIPLFVTNLIEDKKVPLYGDGLHQREWIYVQDNCEALDFVLANGKSGEIYNIGTNHELTNLQMTAIILNAMGKDDSSILFVPDRPAHDRRYSINCAKLRSLGWHSRYGFADAIQETIQWYKDNRWWWEKIKSGEFREYYKEQYKLQDTSQ